jgi:hypothetical protein
MRYRLVCLSALLLCLSLSLTSTLSLRAALPPAWSDADISSPALAGSASFTNGLWTLSGSGADICSSDQFNFAFRPVTGDGTVVAQVQSVQNVPGAQAGVMYRNDTGSGGLEAAVLAIAGNGVSFQWRSTPASPCSYQQVLGITNLAPPLWVSLVRSGTNFSGYWSTDNTNWSQIGSTQSVPLNPNALAGLAVCADNNAALATATFSGVSLPPPVFGVYRELWTNLTSSLGNTLDALTNNANNPDWPDNPDPDFTAIYSGFQTESDTGMSWYGQRLRAFAVPPLAGSYTFWIASGGASQLLLSTDERPALAAPIAWVNNGSASPREWTLETNQQSAPILLQAGQRYYLEARALEGAGPDNLAVRWLLPTGTIEEPMTAWSAAGTRLVPCSGVDSPPGIYQQPVRIIIPDGDDALFTVLLTNQATVAYQWLVNGTNLSGPGALSAAYLLTNANALVDTNQFYSCVVSNALGTLTSAVAQLTVVPVTNPPTVVQAAYLNATNIQILFSEALESASATNQANYVFTNGLPIDSVLLSTDAVTVTLITAPLELGSNYVIVLNGIRERSNEHLPIAADTTLVVTASPYTILGVGNPAPAATLVGDAGGYDIGGGGNAIGGATDQFQFAYQTQNGDFDVQVRLAGMVPTDVWARAGLMARESLLPSGRFAAALASPAMVGSCFEWRDPAGSQANLSGSFPANYPDTWLRLKRAGSTFTGFASYDGQTWVQLGSDTIFMPAQIYLGLAVSSHSTTQATVVQFRDVSTSASAAVVAAAPPNPHEPLGPCSRRTPLVISEIMYNPAPRADLNNVEFLEIYNTNPWFQDISGYQVVSDNISYTFPAGTILNGGAFLVVAASPSSIQAVYGITNVVGPYIGSLKSADTLRLLDNLGAVLLSIPYSNVHPWPVAADGTGHSIVLANPTYGEAQPQAWDISDVVGGSPGQAEAYRPNPLRSVLINEVLAHSENPALLCFIELYNHSNQTNDLSGCILTDDFATNKFVIPPGTFIPPRGFLSFNQSQLGFVPSAAGGTLFFVNPDGSRVLDAVQFEGQADGVSFGRWPDGAAAFYPLAARTPGTNNSPIWIGNIVINELMYDPISGNDDDQYIELYNRGTNTVDLANWQFTAGVNFTFPSGAALAPDSYLVVAANLTNLLAKYPNLNTGNTLGNYGGKLSHKGERVALAMPQFFTTTTGQGIVTNIMYVVQDEVSYETGGRWGQWAHGGGSSLELINPNSDHRLAYNWADSDETMKSAWTNLEYTGVVDNGANYSGSIDHVQLGILDVGECLVDNIEVRPGGPTGSNIVANGTFETGLGNWTVEGDHERSSLETASGLGGYQSSQSLHLRSSDSVWTLADYAQGALSQTTLASGQTATLGLQARWLHGWPEVLMRLRGNWLEVTGRMPVPANLGTPGMRNSRYVANAGPAIYEVKHSPPLPAASQPVVVSARFHNVNPLQPTLLYRVDTGVNPTPAYISVPMLDNGTGGDAVAGDGIFSATIPAKPAGTVVAFLVSVLDSLGGTNLFPADIKSNAGVPRECVVGFGDATPVGSFKHQHVFITQNWANRWAQGAPGVSHEMHDGTWVDGGGRIIYDWMGRYAGSPYHQYQGSPITTLAGAHWDVPHDDTLYGVTSLDKQHVPGNGVLDDNTLQREQASFWMAHQIGLRGQNRRYYVYFVNGNRHGPLMEDAQTPDGDVINEYFPTDNDGYLYKNHAWFEGSVEPSGSSMGFDNESWCVLGRFTTTINGVPNQYKLARYRWMYWARQYPASANDYSEVFNLINAANIPTTSSDYYAQMEAQVDTEEWLRLSAIEHATGDWDSFFTQNQWNMYIYKPTRGKWTALKWDWNITLGGGTSTWGPDGGNLFNYGSVDPIMATFHNYPAHQRAYLRAFQDIANYAMNNSLINPTLNAKYAAFVANGLTTTTWNGGVTVTDPRVALEGWIGTMHNSLLAALNSHGVSNIPFAINSLTVNDNLATISGTAPLAVKTLWFNGVAYPLTWPTITGWTATVPLQPGTNLLSVQGVNINGQPVSGASTTVSATFTGADPSPAGLVVINEIMYNPQVPNAQYIELYNRSPSITLDLSGWQLQGVGYTFPAGSMIQPSSFLVLAANRQAFATAYGPTNLVFDTFPVGLPASGELLTLMQPGLTPDSDVIVNQVLYASTPPWPTNPPGASLQLRDPTQDNWRVGNWAVGQTNISVTNQPQWQYVSLTGTAPRPILLICMHDATGDCYVDDLCLVAGTVPEAGTNLLTDGDFETPLSGPWTVSANMSGSAITTTEKHSGTSSLHVVASNYGDTIADSIWENTAPIVTNGTYTLSYWCLPGANASQLLVRLSGTSPNNGMIYSLQSIEPPSPTSPLSVCTPDAPNSVRTNLPAFPPLWLNELQAGNLTGITNAAGQRVPWLELYNPSTNAVSLAGLYLANNYSNLTQWAFPAAASINPGQFKIIFADGQTNLSTLTELHTSFVLPSPTGSLALSRLFNGQPQVLDFMDYTNLPPNYSYGSLPDGQAFTRQQFFYATPGGSNSAVAAASFIPYTAAGSLYTQAFDSLPNPGPVSVNSANPVTIDGITYSLPNPFDFAAPPSVGGQNGGLGLPAMAGWFGLASSGPNTGVRFGASYGDQTSGGVISFGPPNGANRALGLLATSTTGPSAFGAKFINQTTNIFNLISLQFTGELWRQSDKSKTLQFYYFIDPTATQPFSTSYSGSIPSLNVSFPALASDAGGLAVDGTLASNQTNLSVINQTIANWPPGAALWLFWVMASPTGKAQGLAIDNLSFSASTATTVTAPQLSVLNLTGSSLTLAWPTVAGALYRVQYKDDLAAPAWTTLGNDLPGTGAPLSVDLDLSAAPQRFYRIMVVSGP